MEKPIKTIFNTVIAYIIFAVILCLFFSTIYAVYTACTTLVAGEKAHLFNAAFFLYGNIKVLPVVIFLSSFYMPFYIVRHYSVNIVNIVVYVLLYLAAFFFLIPLAFNLESKLYVNFEKSFVIENISPGYFRTQDDMTLIYSSVDDENIADGVCINFSSEEKSVYVFENLNLESHNTGFTDSLIEKSVKIPAGINLIIRVLQYMVNICKDVISGGRLAWLCFCSLALALSSVIGLRHLSKWRLVNIIFIFLMYILILAFNITVNSGMFLPSVSEMVSSWFKFMPAEVNTFLVLVNLIVSVVLFMVDLIVRARVIREGEQ